MVHELSLTLSEASWAALESDGGTYVVATLDDRSVSLQVAVRIKGWTSAQPITGKPSLKIDLDRVIDGQRYHGLEAFDLHAELTDAAALSEWAAYRLFRDQGLPASRTGWAHLTINDLDYGFYTVVEKKDDQLIKAWWTDHTGSLYESSSEHWPCDLDDPTCDCFELDEDGSTDDRTDLEALCLAAIEPDDTLWLETVSALVPWGAFTGFAATEILIGAHDHYAGFSGNYYLYHEPSVGEWSFIPSSMNNQFGSSRTAAPTCVAEDYTLSDYQHGLLADRCWGDEACTVLLYDALRDAAAHLEDSALHEDIVAVEALIAPYVGADPRSPWTEEQFEGQVDCIQAWLHARPSALRAALPEDCLGEGEDLFLSGVGTLSTNQRCDRETPEAPVYGVASIRGDTVTLREPPVGFSAGDEVLVMVMQAPGGEGVGGFSLGTVDSVGADGIVLTAPPEALLEGQQVTVQRVPTFGDVVVGSGSMLTTGAWDGETGGVLAFRAEGTVRVEAGGQIGMSGRGYRGGATGPSFNTDGYQGEGLAGLGGGGDGCCGYNMTSGWWEANLSGGGALISGGGGAHAGGATAGESWDGTAPAPEPGGVQGTPSLTPLLMGGGGGGVAQIYDSHGPGGAGGGVVLIWAEAIVLEGSEGIVAQGEAATAWTRGTWTYGAGGGAGGSIWLSADTLSLSVDALSATGGAGQTAVERAGGDGGDGRIRVDCDTLDGADCAAADWAGLSQPAVGWIGP